MGFLEDIEAQEEADSEQDRLEAVIDWGQDKDWFEDNFIQSLLKRVKSGKSLTEKQAAAFINVEKMVVEHDEKNEYGLNCDNEVTAYECNSGYDYLDSDDIPF